jgi:Fe-Mn family superoxide dismutase
MPYEMKPLSCDPARIKGMSEKLITSHYENNYGGAVKRLNMIEEQLRGARLCESPRFPGQRSKARGARRDQLDGVARAVLRWAW